MTQPDPNTSIDLNVCKQLVDEACLVAQAAYAPYSNFRVGAVVLASSGKMYRGANVENASYGLGTCAERVALAAARVAGELDLVAIAIACIDASANGPVHGKLPCGACRQWIQELAPNARIFIAGQTESFSVGDLLPYAFRLGV